MEPRDAVVVPEPTDVAGIRGMGLRVGSEVGRLRRVLLHRPGDELRAIRPCNAAQLLFAGPVDVEQARAEHDAFASALRARGVDVLYVEELLAEIASDRYGRRALLATALPGIAAPLRRRLALFPARQLARALIGGLHADDLALWSPRHQRAQLWSPLPNLIFVRDPSTWIGAGVAVAGMATAERRREALLVDALYRLHPRFAASPIWNEGVACAQRFEGGDVLVVDEGRVMLGISPRTTRSGAHRLASALLARRAATEVLTVLLPRGSGFHLDLVATMVDRRTLAVWAPARHELRAHRWRATSAGVAVCAVTDPFAWLSTSTKVIEISDGGRRRERSWEHGVNVLAVKPGVVIAYAHNGSANEQLTAAGIEVVPISGTALARGRGGPRCLSCPMARDEVDD